MRGGIDASTIGDAATHVLAVAVAGARAQRVERQAGGADRRIGPQQRAGQHLVAVQGPQRRRRCCAGSAAAGLVRQLLERRHRAGGRRRSRRSGRGRGRAGRLSAGRPATRRRVVGRPARIEHPQSDRRRGSAPSRTRSTAGRPPTLITSGARSQPTGGCAAEQPQGVAQAVAQRRQPEVLLQRRQRVRERLGQRTGAVERTVDRPVQGGDRPRLQEPRRAAVVDRPLDVLGPPGELVERAVANAASSRSAAGVGVVAVVSLR